MLRLSVEDNSELLGHLLVADMQMLFSVSVSLILTSFETEMMERVSTTQVFFS